MVHKEEKTTNQNNKQKKKNKNNEDSIKSPWDNFKHSNIRFIGVPEGEEIEQEVGYVFEKIMKENFPNFMKDIDI